MTAEEAKVMHSRELEAAQSKERRRALGFIMNQRQVLWCFYRMPKLAKVLYELEKPRRFFKKIHYTTPKKHSNINPVQKKIQSFLPFLG
jgi:DUF1365 family protein